MGIRLWPVGLDAVLAFPPEIVSRAAYVILSSDLFTISNDLRGVIRYDSYKIFYSLYFKLFLAYLRYVTYI